MRTTQKCFECKETFRKEELINYMPLTAKTSHYYCKKCLEEKLARERFSEKVCSIFGILKPGPRIWTERKRLKREFGYTDDTIIDCLDYIYNVEKKAKIVETLYLVTPLMVERMRAWKKTEEYKALRLMHAAQKASIENLQEHVVNVQKNKNINKEEKLNPDDFLSE